MIDDAMREELNALVDGALDAEAAAALRARIDADDALRAEYERLQRVAELVRGLPPVEADLTGDVMAALPPAPVHRLSAWKWGGGIAAAAALVVVSVVFWNPPASPSSVLEASGREDEAATDEQAANLGAKERAPEDVPGSINRLESPKKGKGEPSRLTEAKRARGTPQRRERREAEPETGDAAGALFALVEDRRTQLRGSQRAQYLAEVAAVDADSLARHFARVRRSSPVTFAGAGGKAGDLVLTLQASDRKEADRLQQAVQRAFPEAVGGKQRAGPTVAEEKPAASVAVRRRAKTPGSGEIVVRRSLTPGDARLLAEWLNRTGVPTRREGDGARASGIGVGGVGLRAPDTSKAEASERVPPVVVELRIRYGRPPENRGTRSDDR